jgi:hypothetical protein
MKTFLYATMYPWYSYKKLIKFLKSEIENDHSSSEILVVESRYLMCTEGISLLGGN